MPVWSPDGSRKVAVDVLERFTVYYEVDGERQRREASIAAWPFWLDNETLGIVRAGTQSVQLTNIGSGETGTFLTIRQALMAIPEVKRPATARFTALLAHPQDPNSIVAVVAPQQADGESFLLDLRRSDQQTAWIGVEPKVRLLQSFRGMAQENWPGPGYMRNGRWLNVAVQKDPGERAGLIIYDLQEDRLVLDSAARADGEIFGQGGDWSADGIWFARNLPQRIDLIAPGIAVDGHPARHIVFHEFGRCTSVGWVNR